MHVHNSEGTDRVHCCGNNKSVKNGMDPQLQLVIVLITGDLTTQEEGNSDLVAVVSVHMWQ